MHASDEEIVQAFGRRFGAIEREVPATPPFVVLRQSRGDPKRWALPTATAVALVVLLVASFASRALVLPLGSGGSTPAVGTEPSASPRAISVGDATVGGKVTWNALCGGASDIECDGVVRLFTTNLGRSWRSIVDQSGGRLTMEPRSCPLRPDGLTARVCWDVTAVIASGPFCMVVAHDADDPRYAPYFQIGGEDGAGRVGGLPSGWPMCLGRPNSHDVRAR